MDPAWLFPQGSQVQQNLEASPCINQGAWTCWEKFANKEKHTESRWKKSFDPDYTSLEQRLCDFKSNLGRFPSPFGQEGRGR